MNRTQVYLPGDLRSKIDQVRDVTGESLAEYLRRAAQERLERDQKGKADLKKLADEVVGGARGSRSIKDAQKWIKEIRAARQREE